MREGWREIKLKEFGEIMYGHTAKASLEIDGPKYLRITDIQNGKVNWNDVPSCPPFEKLEKYKLKKGDIVFARTGATTGKSFLIEEDADAVFASYLIRVQAQTQEILPAFLHPFFATEKYWNLIASGISGSAQGGFNAAKLGNLKIPVPRIKEQHQIVALLDQTFAAIDQAKAKIEKNIENAKELFQSKLNEVFSQKGEGWEEKRLKGVARYDKTKYYGEDLPYIGLEHIESKSGNFLGNLEPVTVKSSTFRFDNKHVLYGRSRPYLNKVLVPDFKGHCSTEIFPVLPEDSVHREFLFYWFMSPNIVSQIDATWTGARMPRANMNEVLNFAIHVPSLQVQKENIIQLNNLKQRLNTFEDKSKERILALEELKKSLLQKAFAGELTDSMLEV